MWAFGKASRWARLESSLCWGMVEDKFGKDLQCHIQKFRIKLERSEGSQKTCGYKKAPPQKKITWNVFFIAWVVSPYQRG